ncbi:MAG: bL28 family ribosomal protein [Patescibacteria group bacterium]
MSRRCDICERGSKKSATRSHSNIKTLTRQHLNLQKKTVDGVKMLVCAKCIKTMAKTK